MISYIKHPTHPFQRAVKNNFENQIFFIYCEIVLEAVFESTAITKMKANTFLRITENFNLLTYYESVLRGVMKTTRTRTHEDILTSTKGEGTSTTTR